jgi:hypothetical protein
MNTEQSSDPPALAEVRKSIAKWGYAHSKPGALSDAEVAAAGLVVERGLTLDSLYVDSEQGRAARRGDGNIRLLQRLKRQDVSNN